MNLASCYKNRIGHIPAIEQFTKDSVRVRCSCGVTGSTASTEEEAARLWAEQNGPDPAGMSQKELAAWEAGARAGIMEAFLHLKGTLDDAGEKALQRVLRGPKFPLDN